MQWEIELTHADGSVEKRIKVEADTIEATDRGHLLLINGKRERPTPYADDGSQLVAVFPAGRWGAVSRVDSTKAIRAPKRK